MSSVDKILVPIDGSKNSIRALSNAISLAQQTRATIFGLTVIQSSPTELGLVRTMIGKTISKKSRNFLRTAKMMCTKKKVKFIEFIEYGEEGTTIVSFSKQKDIDLIVMGSRGLGSVKEFFLGSTSSYVMHQSKIPVLIVK